MANFYEALNGFVRALVYYEAGLPDTLGVKFSESVTDHWNAEVLFALLNSGALRS